MQTTDILCVTLAALANARKHSPSIDDRLQLNLSAHNDAYAPVEFITAEGDALAFPNFLDHHPGAIFGLALVPQAIPEGLTATAAAALEGSSPIALAAGQTLYAPIIYFPPETDLTLAQLRDFLATRPCRDVISTRVPLPDTSGLIPADTQRDLAVAFSNSAVFDADRDAWLELVHRHRVHRPARFVFRHRGIAGAPIARPPLETCYSALRDALTALADFAAGTDQRDWAGHFRGAIAQLALAPDPQPLYTVLTECGCPPAAIRLLNAAQSAWVFGGAGSWNDAPTARTASHERLSAVLLDEIRYSLLAAA